MAIDLEDEDEITPIKKEDNKQIKDKNRYNDLISNGIVACALSYLGFYQFYNLVEAIFAGIIGIKINLYSSGLEFQITRAILNDSNQQVIFLSAPILCGFIAYFVSQSSKMKFFSKGIGRSLCFWFIIHGYTFCFGSVISGILLGQNVGFLTKHSKMAYFFPPIFAIVAAIIFVAISVRLVVILMRSVYSRHLLSLSNRPMMIFYMLWLPFLANILLVLLIMVPKYSFFFWLTYLTSILPLLAIDYLARRSYIEIKIPIEKKYTRSKAATVVLGLLVVMYQLGNYFPIRFK
jgi:hypothetical protein